MNNQKKIVNILVIVLVIVIVSIIGYFVLNNKSSIVESKLPIDKKSTIFTVPSQSLKHSDLNVSKTTKLQALSAINAAQDKVDELKKIIQSIEISKNFSLNIISFFISTANAQPNTLNISEARQFLVAAEKNLEQARIAYSSGNYNVALSESRLTQIISITTYFQLIINGRSSDLEGLKARAEKWGNPQNNHTDLASAMQLATTYYNVARIKIDNLDLSNFKEHGNLTENVKMDPSIIDLHDSEDKVGGAINTAANLLDLIVNGPPSTIQGEMPAVSQ